MSAKNIAVSLSGAFIRLIITLAVLLCIAKAGMAAYDFGYQIFSEGPMAQEPGRDIEVTVTQGKSVLDIGKLLEEKGLIRDAKLFWVQEKLSAYKGELKPGIYTLNTSMTADQMMAVMAAEPEESGDGAPAGEAEVSPDFEDATADTPAEGGDADGESADGGENEGDGETLPVAGGDSPEEMGDAQ